MLYADFSFVFATLHSAAVSLLLAARNVSVSSLLCSDIQSNKKANLVSLSLQWRSRNLQQLLKFRGFFPSLLPSAGTPGWFNESLWVCSRDPPSVRMSTNLWFWFIGGDLCVHICFCSRGWAPGITSAKVDASKGRVVCVSVPSFSSWKIDELFFSGRRSLWCCLSYFLIDTV